MKEKNVFLSIHVYLTSITSRAGTAYPSGAPESSPSIFSGDRIAQSAVLCGVLFCRSMFALLFFFLRSLYCLFPFNFLLLVSTLVSSNFSYSKYILSHLQCKRKKDRWTQHAEPRMPCRMPPWYRLWPLFL